MTDWSPNVEHLKRIQTEDPNFWIDLIEVALALKTHNYTYNDNHLSSANQKTINHIIVCRCYNRDNSESNIMKSWVFPCPYQDCFCQCKNPLYIDNGKLHLTTFSQGMDIYKIGANQLLAGEEVVQESEWLNRIEKNFALPAILFVNTILNI